MKEAVTKVIDTLTQEDFHGASQKLLERHNKCIAAGRDYFKGDWTFMSGNLFNGPRIFLFALIPLEYVPCPALDK